MIMMESSSNLDLQAHQEELTIHGSSSALPSSYFAGLRNNHDWNQDLLLNSENCIPNGINGVLSTSSRDHHHFRLNEEIMVQDLGFQWGTADNISNAAESYMSHSNSHDQAYLSKIKEDPNCNNINEVDYHLMPSHHVKHELNGGDDHSLVFDPMNLGNILGRGSFGMILPAANISSLNLTPPSSSSPFPDSLAMELHALDLLASATFGRTLCQTSLSNMALLRDDAPYRLGHDLQDQTQGSSTSHHKMLPSVSGVTQAKRSSANSTLDYKPSQTSSKKPRFETRSSFAPFKVRKEKLGDRIAALQQLVAPFGKTDTASVLMEAIGYIKFLQDQVETLSVPYMRSSGNKKFKEAPSGERDEPKPDLRSRGLCLVPLSCTSYVTNENGGLWSPPSYRGGP